MGCSSSRPTEAATPARRVNISGPVDPPGMVPRRQRDAQGVPIAPTEHELNRHNITQALGYVAHYLHSRGKSLILIAVGGAVNTVLLRTRDSTHDVDVFNPAFSASELSMLRSAVEYAEQQSPTPLGNRWLNNETGTIGGTTQNIPQLIEMARQQNDVVFRAQGLTVLAAPWHYAFVSKIGRITYGTGRPYDAADAAAYLHEHIRRHEGRPVRASEIRKWGQRFRRVTPNEVLEQVDAVYSRTYGQHGIVID
ncbi:hypothetical protein K402DRAFT_328105 [Aulographum hederae CBS 113979]|uniref:DUF7582 domain-containing protein n=1 Tax=Aulographum hederae CBS 113979 TaxID=1176131 RepID=A0A6G1H6R6_9PEZI|nr:hypothetical protein K402DRAFT_328105 [Aulographum hederae CBS 113979]